MTSQNVWVANFQSAVADLPPSSFVFVMATGIVSIAASSLHVTSIAWALFQINKVGYAALALLTAARVTWYWPRVVRDLGDHSRGAGFLTIVAGSCMLGSQYADLAHDAPAALILWGLSVLLWLLLCYGFFATVMVRQRKPPLTTGLNGGWLLVVVATQSVAVLGTRVARLIGPWSQPTLLFALQLFFVGSLLYIMLIALIFYRLLFVRLAPSDLSPLYWINMGALAITTFAGAVLIQSGAGWAFLRTLTPFLDGLTLLFWAMGTWWIPLLILLGIWKHLVRREPLRYDLEYWGVVFPLGMYAQGTLAFGNATGLTLLAFIPNVFLYVALGAWAATCLGFVSRWTRPYAFERWRHGMDDSTAPTRRLP